MLKRASDYPGLLFLLISALCFNAARAQNLQAGAGADPKSSISPAVRERLDKLMT